MPALAFLMVCFALCGLRSVIRTLFGFLPGVLLIGTAFFVTNYNAHQDWRPPYAHRHDGPVLDVVAQSQDDSLTENLSDSLTKGEIPQSLRDAIKVAREDVGDEKLSAATVFRSNWPTEDDINQRWIVFFDPKTEPIVLAQRADDFGCEIRQWNNWYEFPGSYWLEGDSMSTIDRGEQDRRIYLLHLTFGHHGVFSLTPVWILSLVGILPLCFSRRYGTAFIGLGHSGDFDCRYWFLCGPTAGESQLRGLDLRSALVVLAGAAVAGRDDSGPRCNQ